nr:uncharacterized protein LOC111510046 [Leptinotarsa decemlineata]
MSIPNGTIYELSTESKQQNENMFIQNDTIEKDIDYLNHKLTTSQTELAQSKKINGELLKENGRMKKKINSLEKHSKKYNLFINGLAGEEKNTKEDIYTLSRNKLGIEYSESDIRDTYRVGRANTNTTRPVIIEVSTYNLKTEILQLARTKLKNTGIFIAPDNTQEESQKMKFLYGQLKLAREKGSSVNGVLMVNGGKYTYEDLTKSPEEEEYIGYEQKKNSISVSSTQTPQKTDLVLLTPTAKDKETKNEKSGKEREELLMKKTGTLPKSHLITRSKERNNSEK